jgi:competence protein ComEC
MATATIPAVAKAAPAVGAPRGVWAWLTEPVRAPAMVGAGGFAAGILCAHLWWFRPGWLLVALLALFAIAAVAAYVPPRLAWLSVALVFVLLGILCAEIAPRVDRQQELARLADNTPRLVEGEVVRLGPVRRVMAASAFSDKTHEERSQQIDVRIDSLPRSVSGSGVQVTLYAPVEAAFPRIECGDRVRAMLAMHREERFLDPGVWDAGEYLLRQGIGAMASGKPERFAVIAAGRGDSRAGVQAAFAADGGEREADGFCGRF